MKKFACLTISLLAAISAVSGGISASAAEDPIVGTVYPEEFIVTPTFTSLTDYAVSGAIYAFAEENTVKVYDNGEYHEYGFENDITDVDIKDGVIYCSSDNKSYVIPSKEETTHTFSDKVNRLPYGDYFYNIKDGKLYVSDLNEPESLPASYDGQYANIKQFGEKVYAIKDGTALYEITGSLSEPATVTCENYSATDNIVIGLSRTALTTYSEVQFVEIAEGSFMTEVDLEQLNNRTTFKSINTVRASAREGTTKALLLCDTSAINAGNAAIVSIGSKAYVVLSRNVTKTDENFSTENKFVEAQMTGANIYASPYIASGTVIFTNATEKVKIINTLESDTLEKVFCEIEYTLGEETIKGYVAEDLLSPTIIKDDKEPDNIPDPNYSDKSDTKTILIIMAVILLVLAAIAYISHISAKGKKKGKNKKDKDED